MVIAGRCEPAAPGSIPGGLIIFCWCLSWREAGGEETRETRRRDAGGEETRNEAMELLQFWVVGERAAEQAASRGQSRPSATPLAWDDNFCENGPRAHNDD